jgi:hypothetical protein
MSATVAFGGTTVDGTTYPLLSTLEHSAERY